MTTKEIEWTTTDQYMVGKPPKYDLSSLKNRKIAAFDLDHTIIKPLNGKKFSETDSDWELFDKVVINQLKKLAADKYELVIITNQKGISSGKVTSSTFESKIKKIVNLLGLDFVILVSLEDDLYRKPRTKLWDEFVNGDNKTSFYCGDAAGLEGDFSDSDLKFALNVGLKFMYRDEFLYEKPIKVKTEYPVDFTSIINVGSGYTFKESKQEVIINVGLPGSGKSHFTKTFIVPQGYEHINQDILKTKAKCMKLYESFLQNKKSVVIDNTNMSKDQRKLYIDVAKKYGIKCRCMHFTTPKEVCIHNSYYRNYMTDGLTKAIPNMVYNMMNKKYEKPELTEGFYQIDTVKFSAELNGEQEINLYKRFLY